MKNIFAFLIFFLSLTNFSWSQSPSAFKPSTQGINQFVSYETLDSTGTSTGTGIIRVMAKVVDVQENNNTKKGMKVVVLSPNLIEKVLTADEAMSLRQSQLSQNEFSGLAQIEKRDQECLYTPLALERYIEQNNLSKYSKDLEKLLQHLNRQFLSNDEVRSVSVLTEDGQKAPSRILDMDLSSEKDKGLRLRTVRLMQLFPKKKLINLTSDDTMFDSILTSKRAGKYYKKVIEQNPISPIPLQGDHPLSHTQEKYYGKRTSVMISLINRDFDHFIDKSKNHYSLNLQKDNYEVVTGKSTNFFDSPMISVGGEIYGREIIQLDPQHSPLLKIKFEEFVSFIPQEPKATPQEIFQFMVPYLKENIFPTNVGDKGTAKLDQWINSWSDQYKSQQTKFVTVTGTKGFSKLPIIPIDDFIKQGMGVCRHHSLVAAYFIDGLIKKKLLPEGEVRIVRNIVANGGAHAWINYVTKDNNWHIDTLWGVLAENTHQKKTSDFLIEKGYGKRAIEEANHRFIKK